MVGNAIRVWYDYGMFMVFLVIVVVVSEVVVCIVFVTHVDGIVIIIV